LTPIEKKIVPGGLKNKSISLVSCASVVNASMYIKMRHFTTKQMQPQTVESLHNYRYNNQSMTVN